MTFLSRRIFWIIIITATFSLVGGYFSYSAFQNARSEISTHLTTLTESIALAINPQRLSSLTNTSADLTNPDYLRLREQLLAVGRAIKNEGARWIYTAVLQNSQIILSVDGIPSNDPGYNQPGVNNLYDDAPAELYQVFTNGRPAISQPYTDKWGTFVSFFAPIRDFKSHQVVAVLGLDIDYHVWQSTIWRKTMTAVALSFLAWLVCLILYVFLSGRYQRALAVKQSQEMLSAVMESVIDPLIVTDRGQHIKFWNQAATSLFGYNPTQVVGKNLTTLIFPHDYHIDPGHTLEMFAVDSQQRQVPVEVSTALVKMSPEELTLHVIRDITQRRLSEANLLAQAKDLADSRKAVLNLLEDVEADKARTDALLAGIGDGVIAVDADSCIIYINSSAEKMLGLKSSDVVGKKYHHCLKISDHKGKSIPVSRRAFQICLSTGKSVATSMTEPNHYFRSDKSYFPVAINVSPVIIDGQVVGAIDVFRDITHDIEVDRMKTEFISLASHQLRTPLSAMKWFADMLIKGDAGKLNKDQQEFAQNIYDSNERMIDLVNSLLNISRIESGRLMVNPVPTKLSELVNDVVADVKTKLTAKNQNLIISLHPKLPEINLDKSLIRQVYLNLLTNAIKYTPAKGDISITISKDKQNIITQISDSGYDIPAKDHPKVFQKFFRADNIIKHETDGTGLGLYLTKAVIESSGGAIWFKSDEGKGTSFWFSLPIKGIAKKSGEVTLDS